MFIEVFFFFVKKMDEADMERNNMLLISNPNVV